MRKVRIEPIPNYREKCKAVWTWMNSPNGKIAWAVAEELAGDAGDLVVWTGSEDMHKPFVAERHWAKQGKHDLLAQLRGMADDYERNRSVTNERHD